jgi:hypothetical protein
MVLGKLLLLSYIFILSLACQAQIPKDKQLHFAAGATFGSWCFVVGDNNKYSEWKPILYDISGATIAGIGKETYDKVQGGPFDVKDLGATMIGGIVSVGIIEGTRAIIKHHKKHKHGGYSRSNR